MYDELEEEDDETHDELEEDDDFGSFTLQK